MTVGAAVALRQFGDTGITNMLIMGGPLSVQVLVLAFLLKHVGN